MKLRTLNFIILTSAVVVFVGAGCGQTSKNKVTSSVNVGNQVVEEEGETAANLEEEAEEGVGEAEETVTEGSVEAIDTSGWLTYENEEYGFSLRYPRDWTVAEIDKWGCIELASSELTAYNEEWAKQNKKAAQIGTDALKIYDINICREENTTSLPLDSWIEKNVDATWIVSKNDIRFDDIDSIEIVTDALGIWKKTYIPMDTSIIRVSRLEKPIIIDSDAVEEIIATVELIK